MKKKEERKHVHCGILQEVKELISGGYKLQIKLQDGTERILRYETKQEVHDRNQMPSNTPVEITYGDTLLCPEKITLQKTGLVLYGQFIAQAACPHFLPIMLNQYEE